ncbi:DUF2398 family protein [Actinoplanes sp. NPDC051475]|uniref:DUF2398 family protein n=1 Tax=Actinoplanes sp. NPDC051475 TaxID=3157225 RepID=UPI0034500188
MSDLYDVFADFDDDQAPANELSPIISALLRRPFLTEESDSDVYRLARLREEKVRGWFQSNLGWRVKTSGYGRYVRLFKRREQPPADRCPVAGPNGGPSSPLVLVLLCLAAEQLWRRPEITYGDLQREVIRICAEESTRDVLPQFQVVTEAGESRARADQHRRAFVEALMMLQHWHVVSTDRPLAIGGGEASGDVIITCNPERLNDFLAVTAISQMQIDIGAPQTHVARLCQDQADLPGHASESQHDLQRRHRALRAVLDDAVVVLDGESTEARYLATPGGRRHALHTATETGLTCIVRRDIWLTSDHDHLSTDLDFPQPRSIPGQAALLLLRSLDGDDPPPDLTQDCCQAVIEQALTGNVDWAKSYRTSGAVRTLTRDALTALTSAGVLRRHSGPPETWSATGAHAYWRICVTTSDRPIEPVADDDLFSQDGNRD